MKVFTRPVGLHSRAMIRVANALEEYAPTGVEFVKRCEDADLQVLHVIGWDDSLLDWPRDYAVIQYCLNPKAQNDLHQWVKVWSAARLTWSYFDLENMPAWRGENERYRRGFEFLYAPLGVGEPFNDLNAGVNSPRDLVMTSGFATGPGTEAIEEVWNAAERVGLPGVHVGPANVQGMKRRGLPKYWQAAVEISDERLADFYRRARYVSGLRHFFGFELPAAEGMVCGATPILFNGQDSQRHWYGGSGRYAPETDALERWLEDLFASNQPPLQQERRQQAAALFNWGSICTKFWNRVIA